MSDLISRQAAIDAICTEGTRLERNGTVAMAEIKQWCVDILEALPSADNDGLYQKLNEAHNEGYDVGYWAGREGYDVGYWAGRRDYEQKWIPCSERLPSEGQNVLLCETLFGKVAIGKLISYNTSCCWEVDHWDCDIEDWQAWMPLPEPYETERKEE